MYCKKLELCKKLDLPHNHAKFTMDGAFLTQLEQLQQFHDKINEFEQNLAVCTVAHCRVFNKQESQTNNKKTMYFVYRRNMKNMK